MRKAFDIAFTALAACVLAAVLVPMAVGALLQADSPTRSYLEGRAYQQFPDLSVSSVQSGAFQDDFEQFAADHVPGRDYVILANASMQRAFIEAANAPLGFGAYPSFFGSDFYVVPSEHSMVQKPLKVSAKKQQNLEAFSSGVSQIAARYPDVRFAVLVGERSNVSEANPATTLIANSWTTSEIVEALSSHLGESKNVVISSNSFSNLQDFYQWNFKTDHHWTLGGAADVYNGAAGFLGKDELDARSIDAHLDEVYFGSNARNGLCRIGENQFSTNLDLSTLTIKFKSGKTVTGDDHSDFFNLPDSRRCYVSYNGYYGAKTSRDVTITSTTGDGTALLIVDSYGDAMRLIVGGQYEHTYVYNDLHHESKNADKELSSLIDELHPDAVIFAAWADDYASHVTRMPSYFE